MLIHVIIVVVLFPDFYLQNYENNINKAKNFFYFQNLIFEIKIISFFNGIICFILSILSYNYLIFIDANNLSSISSSEYVHIIYQNNLNICVYFHIMNIQFNNINLK